MRKIIVLNRITLDGMFDGPNGENDWFIPGDAENKAAHDLVLPLGRCCWGASPTSIWLAFGRPSATTRISPSR